MNTGLNLMYMTFAKATTIAPMINAHSKHKIPT